MGEWHEPDPAAVLLYYSLHKLRKLPHEILDLPIRERAFVFAAIQVYTKKEAEAAKKAK